VVGLMVGAGVKKGCRGRGGWLYQSLAILLTYFAIVTTYIPLIIKGAVEAPAPPAAAATAPEPGKPAPADPHAELSALGCAIAAIFVFVAAVVLPIIAPFMIGGQAFISWLIIAFALYEAFPVPPPQGADPGAV
jgi:nitrate reductase NapE component